MAERRERFKASSSVFVLLRRGRHYCFIHRTNTGWMDGYYSVPAGGMERGETIKSAAIREALEEVGVVIRPEDLHYKHLLHCLSGEDAWLGHFLLADKWTGEPMALETDKHDHCLWRSHEEIQDNLIPYVRVALEGIREGELYSEFGWQH